MHRRDVLLMAANLPISTTLGDPVGFWAFELVHPWHEFTVAGYLVKIASSEGGAIRPDGLSDPRDESGYSAHDILSLGFLSLPSCAAPLETAEPLSSIDVSAYNALLIRGGPAPMFTFRGDERPADFGAALYKSGKPTSALCHGVAALIDAKLSNGQWRLAGRTMTGFANDEEDIADSLVGKQVMP